MRNSRYVPLTSNRNDLDSIGNTTPKMSIKHDYLRISVGNEGKDFDLLVLSVDFQCKERYSW